MSASQSILITGASSGIGAALALLCAAPGVTLALGGRNAPRLDAVAHSCRAKGAEVETALLDVTDEAGLRDWVARVDARRPLDLVIASAGISSGFGDSSGAPDLADTRAVMRVNFDAACVVVDAILPAMQARRHGQIALVGSLAGLRGLPVAPAYCASKAALLAYGDALRPLAAASGVRIAVILPGFVDTAMSQQSVGPKPMMISAERAAEIIRARLARGHRVIAFPRILALALRLLGLLPAPLADALLRRALVARQR